MMSLNVLLLMDRLAEKGWRAVVMAKQRIPNKEIKRRKKTDGSKCEIYLYEEFEVPGNKWPLELSEVCALHDGRFHDSRVHAGQKLS